jgi:hypothetical protein
MRIAYTMAMSKITDAIAATLDDCIVESFAAAALAKGLSAALARGNLRATAELLVRALLDGALLENAAPATEPAQKKPKKAPPFARALVVGWLSHGSEPKHAWREIDSLGRLAR